MGKDRALVYSRRGVQRRVTELYSVAYRYIVVARMERSIRHLMRFPSVLKSALRLATLAVSTQALSSLVIAGPAVPQLTPPTIEAFNDYVRLTEARNAAAFYGLMDFPEQSARKPTTNFGVAK